MIPIEWIYNKAIAKWGIDAQIRVSIEEFAELIVELAKYGRKHNGTTRKKIIDEIADAEIMLGQLEMIFGREAVEKRMKFKLERIERRLK